MRKSAFEEVLACDGRLIYANVGDSMRPFIRQGRDLFPVGGLILTDHPGKWEIKYNEKNPAGKRLWNTAAAPY